MAITDCRYFSGYKPCGKSETCTESCASQDIPQNSILIVHLGALGAVVRSTALLAAIKRKYPQSMITWVTEAPADQLLKNHPLIDRILVTKESDLLQLGALSFDVGFVIDKSLKAVGVLKFTSVQKIFGFTSQPHNGAIVPATAAAEELWQLGLNNQKKFFENKKPETQLMIEALELGAFRRDDYNLPLTLAEDRARELRRSSWLAGREKDWIVGLNTGCSHVIPYKKLSVEFQQKLIARIHQQFPQAQVVLLGGPEDTTRNQQIAGTLVNVISSATESGLRDGLISVAACDVVITGDSLGMHMAISQKKQVIAWFGPTCAQEIDLYDRGIKIEAPVSCRPCWKRTCEKSIMCYDQVSLEEIIDALKSCSSNRFSGRPAALHPLIKEVPSALA